MGVVYLNRKIKWVVGVAAAILVVAGAAALLTRALDTSVTVIAPTCTEKGYTVYVRGGKTSMGDLVDATGHDFSQWETVSKPSGTVAGSQIRRCNICGYEETESFFDQEGLPKIYLSGDISGISKRDQAAVTAKFSIEGIDFDGYAQIKYQGHSSLEYDKKNFTIKFFSDERCEQKEKFTFSHWNKENKYILKANYTDVSRSRNLICADLWSQMVDCRQSVHPRLKETSNNGAVDGFPVELYLNDGFYGIYNVTLHKDDGLFAMEDGQKDGIVIINETDTDAAYFRGAIDWMTTEDWEVEYCGTEDARWLTEQTDAFVDFIMNSTDEAFAQQLHQYADVESLIDYMIAMYVMGLTDHDAADLVLVTYEEDVFIASLFDMEDAFGLKQDGSGFEDVTYLLPRLSDGEITSGSESLLWDRLLKNFYPQICERYAQLRAQVLSEANIIAVAQARIQAVPEDVNREDMALYPEQPQQDISHLEQIESYMTQRLALLDEIFLETSQGGNS